ncbi:MAG: PLP-dependent cysteine synthase family protein [Candidatus Aramenus sp.]|nr:PLP-dependent cysteine synthase family protein [Candidatus Aramenus sp.]
MSREYHVFENPIELLEGMWPTPLLKLSLGKELWAKLEFYNPFSKSIKDRTAWYLFKQALESGKEEVTEATSGNVGVSLSAFSAIFSRKFTAFIPSLAPKTFKVAMKVLGANVIQAGSSTNELLPLVKKYSSMTSALHLDQFSNPLNVKAHYETTAREIDEQLKSVGRRVERIIATAGTGGHLTGLSKYFKERYPDVEVIGVQPAKGSRIPGIKRQEGDGFVSQASVDRIMDITLEEAFEGVKKVAKSSGILIGLSAGATVAAYEKIADERVTVLVFPDDMFKYIDEIAEMLDIK